MGRNVALTLAKNGGDVVLTYRQGEGRAVLAEIEQLGRKGALLQIDVADVASFGSFAESLRKTLREELGRETLDFLINNAGIDSAAPFARPLRKTSTGFS